MPCPDRRIGGQQETLDSSHFSTVQFGFLHCAICISSPCSIRISPQCNLLFFTVCTVQSAFPSRPRCNSIFSTVHFAFLHRAICISSLCAIYISAISSHAFSQNLNEHFVLSISAYFSQHQQFDEVHLIAKSVT